MSDDAPRITITIWQGLRVATCGQRLDLTWDDLCAFLSPCPPPPFAGEGSDHPVEHPSFDPGQQGWSPCSFAQDRRKKDAIELIHLLAFEHDAGTVSIERVVALLTALGIDALIITTKSHAPTCPRWRLVIRLSRPLPSLDEREALYLWACTLGLELAPAESRDPSRFWFTTCRGAHETSGLATRVHGAPLQVDPILASLARPTTAEPSPSSSPSASSPAPAPADLGNTSAYVRTALDRAHQAIASAGKGSRHTVTSKEAYALGGLVGGGHLPRHLAESTLRAAVDRAWPDPRDPERDRDGYRTVRSQLDAGARSPRSIAPSRPQPRPRPSVASPSAAIWSPASMPKTANQPVAVAVAVDQPDPHTHDSPEGSHLRGRIRVVPKGADPVAETKAGILSLMLRSQGGAPRKIVANATTIFALDPRWSGVIAYQSLSDRVVKLKAPEWHAHDAPTVSDPGAWTDADTTRAQAWLSREYGLDLGAETVNAAVVASAEQRVIDPLKDYFDGLRGTWDGKPRCDLWLGAIFNAPDTIYSRAVGSRWLISCVARALRPGCQVDHVLVLEGLQGKGKSTALRMLCPLEELFFEGDLALGDKDAIQVLRGKWIIELGELGALNRHEIQMVKAFVTRRIDTYRPSFGRIARDFPRRFAFSGSTNEEEYLRDPTGNRRWWPVKARGPIDLATLELHRDQLWAEALTRFELGEVWYLETSDLVALARGEQEQREEVDAWDERVGSYLARALHDAPADAVHSPACQCVRCHGVTTGSVLVGALGLEWAKLGLADQKRVGGILRALGWAKGAQRREGAGRVRPYFPPGSPESAED